MRSLKFAVKRYAAPNHLFVTALAIISFGSLGADPVPKNLANGLYDVVVDSQTPAAVQHSLVRTDPRVSGFKLRSEGSARPGHGRYPFGWE